MNTSVLGELAGQMLGGRYLVGEPIARGGMATVYLATDTRLQRTVALKVLRPDLSADADFMQRFQREALATAALSHPNVVSVFDFDASGNLAFLVLEYVPGETLRALIKRHRLTPAQALAVLDPILDALVVAHGAGIVHRDIKPENVLLGPRGAVKVADFGLARALDDHEHKTRTGLVIGTAAYVSPEHVNGTGTAAPSDIYSAGILLFELLTGSPPYAGENALSVAVQHVNNEVPRPSDRLPDLPTELDELVLGATAKDPADRFASAADFLSELRRVQGLLPPAEPLPRPIQHGATIVLTDKPAAAEAGAQGLADSPAEADSAAPVADQDGTTALAAPKDADAPAEPSSKRRRGRRLLLVLLLIAIICGAAWAFLAGPLQRATVPDLVGLSQTDAGALLEETGLQLRANEEQYSETAPKDTIISQRPVAEAGTFVQFPVNVVISLGPERYEVPKLQGMTPAEARTALQDTKLDVAGQEQAHHETIEKGLVIRTDPKTGTSLKPQTEVTLIISKGPAPRPVPDVLGMTEKEALAALEEAGLEVEKDEAFNEEYPAGEVAAVAPKVGTKVAKGSTVAVTISKGPPPVEVPRVVDMKREDAIARLQNAGFIVNVQAGIVTPLNRVYSQDPPPGEFRPKGSTVTISIF